MKHGIFYGYWTKDWSGDYVPLVKRAKKCGFDVLAISTSFLLQKSGRELAELKSAAADCGIELHSGFGPNPHANLTSADPEVVRRGIRDFRDAFEVLEKMGITFMGGANYTCSPFDLPHPLDKAGDLGRLRENLGPVADMAADHGITMNMEVVCRYEGYMITTVKEGADLVRDLGRSNLKLILDTFHMSIEEESFGDAIRYGGETIGCLHTGECDRKLPGMGHRVPWQEIADALRDIRFDGPITMEPFMIPGGEIGEALGVYRDLTGGADDEELDRMAMRSLAFSKALFG